jgi:hypothetical protein
MDWGNTEQGGDLPGATILDAGRMIHKACGDHVHQSSGQHLNGGVEGDQRWQDCWQRLVVFPSLTHNAPSGAAGWVPLC